MASANHGLVDNEIIPLARGIVAVAIDRDRNSPHAVRWTIQNILPPNSPLVLIHVVNRNTHQQNKNIDCFMDGNNVSSTAQSADVFATFRVYCARTGVAAKEVILEDSDVSKALLHYVSNNSIANIVIGASTRPSIARKLRSHDVTATLNKYSPDFCSVYTVAKDKLINLRPAVMGLTVVTPPRMPSPKPSSRPELEDDENRTRAVNRGGERERFKSPNKLNSTLSNLPGYDGSTNNLTTVKSGAVEALPQNSDLKTDADTSGSPRASVKNLGAEMKRLKMELRQTKRMFDTACKETESENKKADELYMWKTEEAPRIEKAMLSEVSALAIVEMEKAKAKTAIEAAEKAQKLAKLEKQKRLQAEMKAKQELDKKRSSLNNSIRCRSYTLEEIETATDGFAESAKIGEGGYGPVFKGRLENTPVAIKVLRADAKQGKKQFQREVEILSRIRHPNMVLLLGACPEYGSLVYEFMDYGSLEDRLYQRGKTPPIPWRTRFKIATDIAIGLLFLHQTKPEPLVHRDLKPANILLDKNFVCKIGDVGLAHLVPASVANEVTQYHMTSAAGTLCYIDPEYQQTGSLGTKSDIYSLGIVLLQILTGRRPSGITRHVEDALEKGTFSLLLDPSVSDWPVEEATDFAKLALKCVELRKRDRPDLATVVLPELSRISNMDLSAFD